MKGYKDCYKFYSLNKCLYWPIDISNRLLIVSRYSELEHAPAMNMEPPVKINTKINDQARRRKNICVLIAKRLKSKSKIKVDFKVIFSSNVASG